MRPGSRKSKGQNVTRRKEIDRDRILDAAEHVIVESGGRNFTLDAVAERAGISKGGLVYSFATKDGLVRAALEREVTRFQDAVRQRVGGRPVQPFELVLAHIEEALDEDDAVTRKAAFLVTASAALLPRAPRSAPVQVWRRPGRSSCPAGCRRNVPAPGTGLRRVLDSGAQSSSASRARDSRRGAGQTSKVRPPPPYRATGLARGQRGRGGPSVSAYRPARARRRRCAERQERRADRAACGRARRHRTEDRRRPLPPLWSRDDGREEREEARRDHAADAHRSEKVARGYIRHAKLFDDNAAVGLA
jgi:AcrR family transcriptional regulator